MVYESTAFGRPKTLDLFDTLSPHGAGPGLVPGETIRGPSTTMSPAGAFNASSAMNSAARYPYLLEADRFERVAVSASLASVQLVHWIMGCLEEIHESLRATDILICSPVSVTR